MVADMYRREFIKLIVGAAAVRPLAVRATPPMSVIGFLHSASAQPNTGIVDAFSEGLRETGYTQDQNIAVEYRWAEEQNDRLPGLAAELVRRQVAVIAANSVSALAVKAATPRIPIVFQSGVDPVKIGLVASLGHPGGNVTGVSYFASTLEMKKLELLHELIPKPATIAVLVNPKNPQAGTQVNDSQSAAAILGRHILILNAGTKTDINGAFVVLVQEAAKAVVVIGDPFFNSRRKQLIALAARYGLPAIYSNRENVDEGGLLSYGAKLTEAYRQVGIYTGRILKGAKPADLPVVQPTEFELIINLNTAKALGLNLPLALLDRADQVIE
jgi:putative tryptophan/tyrosine transport system substrate-binding protein